MYDVMLVAIGEGIISGEDQWKFTRSMDKVELPKKMLNERHLTSMTFGDIVKKCDIVSKENPNPRSILLKPWMRSRLKNVLKILIKKSIK